MVRICEDCAVTYDDVGRSTLCPHHPIMSVEHLTQKLAGIDLLGKRVQFKSNPLPGGPFRVWAVEYTGLISLDGVEGEFAPHLVQVVD